VLCRGPAPLGWREIYAWNQLGRRVKRGEKGIMIRAPIVGRKRNTREEKSESDAEQADAKSTNGTKSNGSLIGFRPVYVWDRLSRDLRPSLCAPDVFRQCHFRKSPR
jgi:hypothetical protein